MVSSEGIEQVGAALPRRLLGLAVSIAWIVGSVGVAWLLWPTSLGGCTTLTIVSGESMEPTYYTGDLVVSRCGEAEVGDVITYNPPGVDGVRVIHRIVDGTAEDGWVVQGDNNNFLDPWQPTAEDILGSAVLRLPHVGKVAQFLLSPLTWVSLLVVALAIVVWPGRPAPEDELDETDEGAAQGAEEGPGQDPADPHTEHGEDNAREEVLL